MKFLTLCLAFATLTSVQAADPAKWEKEIVALEKKNAAEAPPKGGIIFIGSSSIRMWETLKEDFAGLPVINHGFGGSQISDSTHFADRLIFPYEPKMIVMYAGGNDLNAKRSPDEVVADFQAFVAKIRSKLPEAKIAYISVAGNPARWAQVEQVKEVNRRIEKITKEEKGLMFIDVFQHMLGPDGLPKADIFLPDKLHMNEKGYALWKELVGKALKEAGFGS